MKLLTTNSSDVYLLSDIREFVFSVLIYCIHLLGSNDLVDERKRFQTIRWEETHQMVTEQIVFCILTDAMF